MNIFLIKIKHFLYPFYLAFYKLYIKIHTIFFNGPPASYPSYNFDNIIYNNENDYNLSSDNIESPLFFFYLVNKGLWYIFENSFWLGSQYFQPRVKLNITKNQIFSRPLLYSRKRGLGRILEYHRNFIEKLYFVRFLHIFLLLNFLLSLILFFFFFLLIPIYTLFLPFILVFFLKINRRIVKEIKVGILLLFLHPISYYKKKVYEGNLNNRRFLGIENYFFRIRALFFKKYNNIDSNVNNNNYLTIFNKSSNDFKKKISPFFYKMKNFWEITHLSRVSSFIFLRNFIFKVINYFTFKNGLTYFFSLFLFYYVNLKVGIKLLYRRRASKHLSYLNLIIDFSSIYIVMGKLCLLNLFKIFFYFLLTVVSLYFNFYFISLIWIILFVYIFYEFYLLRTECLLKNIKIFRFYIVEDHINYSLISNLNYCSRNLNSCYVNFTFKDYKTLLKLESNIAIFENYLNNICLEQEFFYKKREILEANLFDNYKVMKQMVLKKYYKILLRNNLISYKIIGIDRSGEKLRYINFLKILKFLNNEEKISYDEYKIVLKSTLNKNLESNNLNFSSNDLDLFLDSDKFSKAQKYYYYKYGIKLFK